MGEKQRKHKSFAGQVLAATPTLIDPNFAHTLVYLVKHDAEGAFGLVMNKPTGKKISEAVASPDLPDELDQLPLYFGGPVHTDSLLMAVFEYHPARNEVTCKLEMNFEQLAAYLKSKNAWVRSFIGCSGWGKGQLEQELEGNYWKVCATDPLIFEEKYSNKIWSVFFQGVEDWRDMLPFLPEHPEWN